ncbi:MAG: sodium:proton antiporter [Clostridiales bacterium GWE2_32_10]|nr:MAG: sodium:proton antiporter [Clostridiales bacterium GWE2_32_10]HBY19651.1 sodium:proton antiporter [Clostridiales bacterium]
MIRINEMFKKLYKISLVVLLAIFLLYVFNEIHDLASKSYLSEHYISKGVQETGAINLVTSVLYDYRSFDTLGEATVILTASAILAFLVPLRKVAMHGTKFLIIVHQTMIFIVPYLAVLGSYLILFGHLNPGGGFVGGVVLALIPIVMTITYCIEFSEYKFKPNIKTLLEDLGSICFIILGLFGIVTGSNFLASGQSNLGLGNPGELISGGLILCLNIIIGIKVGAGMAKIFNSLIKGE